MSYCRQYLTFQQEARAVANVAARLYVQTGNPRVIAGAKQQIERLGNSYLRRLPSVHCANGRCVLTEWKRLVAKLDKLAGQDQEKGYGELLAQVKEKRERLPGRSILALEYDKDSKPQRLTTLPLKLRERSVRSG